MEGVSTAEKISIKSQAEISVVEMGRNIDPEAFQRTLDTLDYESIQSRMNQII